MYDDSKTYIDTGFRNNWDNYYKVYKGKRVFRNYEGIADPNNREAHTIIETLVANIAGGPPQFHYVKTNEEQSDDTEILNNMMDYYMICNQMGLKNQEWVRDMLMYGTGILGVEWRGGKPFIFNISLRDFFFDPTSTGMVQTINPARYAGFEYLGDKEMMKKQQIYDADKKEWVPKYTGLDDIGISQDGKDGDHKGMDKALKDSFNGSTLGEKATERQVHVIKLYDLFTGRLVEIGNRKKLIYDKPMWCQREEMSREVLVDVDGQLTKTTQVLDAIDPFLPFAALRDYVDSSLFLGEGEMAIIIDDAELLNDYEAMDVDNNAYQNTPMYWIDPQFADLAPEIETIPGAVYPIPRNAMGALERPQLSGDLDAKKAIIAARMRRATAADEAVQGVSQQKGRVTATEVNTQLAQAQNRFSTKLTNLGSEGYAQLGDVIFKCVQIFVTKKTAIRIVGPMGVKFKDYDPWEYNGEWEAHVELDSEIQQKQVEVGLKDQAVYESLKDLPTINQTELARWWTKLKDPSMTDEKFNKLIMPPAPPKDDTKDFVNVAYKDLEPWAKLQWQKNVGWEQDPQLLGEIHNKMLEQANVGADHLNPTTDASGNMVPGMESLLQPAPAGAGAAVPVGA